MSSANKFWVRSVCCTLAISSIRATTYTALGRGSRRVVPFLGSSFFCRRGLMVPCTSFYLHCVERGIAFRSIGRFWFIELSASISNKVSPSPFSKVFRREWMACSTPYFCSRLGCLLEPSSIKSCKTHFAKVRQMNRLKTSLMPIERRPVILSTGTSLQAYSWGPSEGICSEAVRMANIAIDLVRYSEASSKTARDRKRIKMSRSKCRTLNFVVKM